MRMSRQAAATHGRGFFASRVFIIVGLIVTLLILLANVRAFYRDRAIRQEIAALEQQRQQLTQKKLESMEILQYVTSKDFVEEKARTELNMKRPGEQVIIVQEIASSEIAQGELGDIQGRQAPSNPVKWWYYFSHRSYDS